MLTQKEEELLTNLKYAYSFDTTNFSELYDSESEALANASQAIAGSQEPLVIFVAELTETPIHFTIDGEHIISSVRHQVEKELQLEPNSYLNGVEINQIKSLESYLADAFTKWTEDNNLVQKFYDSKVSPYLYKDRVWQKIKVPKIG